MTLGSELVGYWAGELPARRADLASGLQELADAVDAALEQLRSADG